MVIWTTRENGLLCDAIKGQSLDVAAKNEVLK